MPGNCASKAGSLVHLIVREPSLEREMVLDSDFITIGRSKVNTVILNEAQASARHCILEKREDRWFLTDLETEAGTVLNGRRVKDPLVPPGSVITIGATRIHFEPALSRRQEIKTALVIHTPSRMRKALPVMLAFTVCLLALLLAAHTLFFAASYEQPCPVVCHEAFGEEWEGGRVSRWWPGHPRIERTIIEPDIPLLDGEFDIVACVPRGTSFDRLGGKNLDYPPTPEQILNRIGRVMPGDKRFVRPFVNRCCIYRASDFGLSANNTIVAALRWLYFHQSADGRWDADGFFGNCDATHGTKCDGKGNSNYDVGVTSLALLAFTGAGHNHKFGVYRGTVKRGLNWLRLQQDDMGRIGKTNAQDWVYNHALATTALCSAYATTRDYRLKKSCEKAVAYIISARNPGLGWGHEPKNKRSNTSVTGCMVLALSIARDAGFHVDRVVFQDAIKWFDSVTQSYSGKTGYILPGDKGSSLARSQKGFKEQPSMTALATFCRILCGVSRLDKRTLKGIDILLSNLPDWNKPKCDKVDMYYWYWATHAMKRYGGQSGRKWQKSLQRALLETQRVGGCMDGSWDPVGKWGMVGGRVYSTAINCLALETQHINVVSHSGRRDLKWAR